MIYTSTNYFIGNLIQNCWNNYGYDLEEKNYL